MITILITTHNRTLALKRNLDYYSRFAELKIFILDSSAKLQHKKNRNLSKIYKNKNIFFLKYKTNSHIASKVFYSLNKIKSEFVVICPDDDFIVFETLQKCMIFLKKNKSFICCLGKQYTYPSYLSKFSGFDISENAKMQKTVNSNNKDIRIKKYLENLGPIPFYGVYRTSDFKKIWKQTYKINNNVYFSEIIQAYLTYYYGKIKKLDCVYIIRHPNLKFIKINLRNLQIIFNQKSINLCSRFFKNKLNLDNRKKIIKHIEDTQRSLSIQNSNLKKNIFFSTIKIFLRPLVNFLRWNYKVIKYNELKSLPIIRTIICNNLIFNITNHTRNNFKV